MVTFGRSYKDQETKRACLLVIWYLELGGWERGGNIGSDHKRSLELAFPSVLSLLGSHLKICVVRKGREGHGGRKLPASRTLHPRFPLLVLPLPMPCSPTSPTLFSSSASRTMISRFSYPILPGFRPLVPPYSINQDYFSKRLTQSRV